MKQTKHTPRRMKKRLVKKTRVCRIQMHRECFTACPRCGHETQNADDDVCLALAPEAGRSR